MAEPTLPGTSRPLTRQRAIGITALDLLGHWGDWVDRRIESVTFQDPSSRLRRISVDLTYPERATPDYEPDGTPIYLVPLGILRKQPLVNFSLWDETNRALPLLTRGQNAEVAASVLVAYAERQANEGDTTLKGEAVPESLFDEFLDIASSDPSQAIKAWEKLVSSPSPGSPTTPSLDKQWREALVVDPRFMALAYDSAIGFLVLTPVPNAAGQRRILKFRYEEQNAPPPWRIRVRVRQVRGWLQRELDRFTLMKVGGGKGEKGRLELKLEVVGPGLNPEDWRFPLIIRTSKDEYRVHPSGGKPTVVQLPTGTCHVQVATPDGLIPTTAVDRTTEVKFDQTTQLAICFRLMPGRRPIPPAATLPPSLWLRFWRGVSWAAKGIEIQTPAVGQGGSYHLEVEAPEGLLITQASLTAIPSQSGTHAPPMAPAVERTSLERVHLPLRRVPQEFSGKARLFFRPRVSTLIRAAFLSALFTTILLALATQLWPRVTGNTATVAGLLLVLPGGLAAYVARSSESPVTTQVLIGLRLLALSTGLWSFLAAAVLVLSRRHFLNEDGQVAIGAAWSGTEFAMYALAVLSTLVTALLGVAWWRSWRPPERSK